MCGVSHMTIERAKGTCNNVTPATVTGRDGKTYSAKKAEPRVAVQRRAVEVALQEFGNLSSRAIAGMCGVSRRFVDGMRPTGGNGAHLRTGQDGKTYPAR